MRQRVFKYLIMLDLPKEDLEHFKGDDAIVTEFKSKIFELNENERFQLDMTQEEVDALVINTGKALAYEDGMAEGEKQKQVEIAKKMLEMNFTKEQIKDATELTLEEIEKININ